MNQVLSRKDILLIVKPACEEDLHKAIKYNVWSSKSVVNKQIQEMFGVQKFRSNSLLLLFATSGKGCISGLARVTSKVTFTGKFTLWTSDDWNGYFSIEWLVIKDMPFKELEIQSLDSNESNVAIYYMRDGSLVNSDSAQMLLEDYLAFQPVTSVVDHFEFYDVRETNYLLASKELGNK